MNNFHPGEPWKRRELQGQYDRGVGGGNISISRDDLQRTELPAAKNL